MIPQSPNHQSFNQPSDIRHQTSAILLRCFVVNKKSNDGKDNIGYPGCYQGMKMPFAGKNNGKPVHYYKCSRCNNTKCQVQTAATPGFAAGYYGTQQG